MSILGPLLKYIEKKKVFTEKEASLVVKDIVSALDFLHKKGTVICSTKHLVSLFNSKIFIPFCWHSANVIALYCYLFHSFFQAFHIIQTAIEPQTALN